MITIFTANLQTHGFQTSLFPEVNCLFRVGLVSITIAVLVVVLEAISPMILEQTIKGAKSQGFMCYWVPLSGNPDLKSLAIVERGEALTQPTRTGKQVDYWDGW
ncbi:hypothetical protein A9Z50_14150 [Aeromonas hydrophila]|nr:hypothetical protein [Aeromonas hydrophila]